uniref:Uncharacterized protein n=1 Tax=Kalanchoe fedtschenkoi TaxID=63787 RepID=A0A7N0UFA1_KALFE
MAWASAGRPRKRQIPVSSSALPYPGLPACPVAIRLSLACAYASRASELLERHASLGCCALVRMRLDAPPASIAALRMSLPRAHLTSRSPAALPLGPLISAGQAQETDRLLRPKRCRP